VPGGPGARQRPSVQGQGAAVLDAEEGSRPRDVGRVSPTEIPDGRWGGNGRIVRRADILARVTGADEARRTAEKRIAASRADRSGIPG
jgi:hypothetical protein